MIQDVTNYAWVCLGSGRLLLHYIPNMNINVIKTGSICLIWMLCLVVSVAHAQSVEEVLTHYYKNTGGLKAWKNLKTMIMQGVYPSPQGSFGFVIYKKAPDKIKLVVNISGHEIIPQAYDGTTAWTLNPMIGGDAPRQLPETVAREVAANAEFQDAFINYQQKGHEVSYVGTAEVDSVKTYVLKLEKNKNNDKADLTEFHYFDAASYFPILIKTTTPSGQESLTYLANYQKTDGRLIMPFAIESKIAGQTVNKIIFKKITPEQEDQRCSLCLS